MKRLNVTQAVLFAAIFLDLVGFGMVIPDFQLRAEKMGAPGGLIGLILASMFIVQTIVTPKWGILSDRRGRKLVMVICWLLSAASLFIYGAATTIWMLLISRIVAGLGGATVSIAQAFLSDLYDEEHRTIAMGRISAAVSSGLVLGPVVGGYIAGVYGSRVLGIAGGCASLLAATALILFLPAHPPVAPASLKKRLLFDFSLLRDFPKLQRLVWIAIIAWFSLAMLEGTFGRLIKQNLGLGQKEYGWIFGYESFLGVLIPITILALAAKRLGEFPLLRVSYVLQGLGLAITPLQPNLLGLFLASTLYALGSGMANPTLYGLCSRLAPADRQGELFGLMQGARSIGFVLGPILGGMMFDWHDGLPYYFAGAVCLLAAFLVRRGE